METFLARYRLRDAQKALARVERRTALARRSRPDLLPGLAVDHVRAVARVRAAHLAKAEADGRAEIRAALEAEARERREATDPAREWVRAGLWAGLFAFLGIFPPDGPSEG